MDSTLQAQQMTLQAMTISQQQQEQKRLPRGRASDSSRTRDESLRRSSPESPRPRRASPRRRSPEVSHSRRVSQRRWSPEPSQPSPTRVLTREISPEPSRPRQTSPQSLPSTTPELQRLNSSKRDVSIPKAPESPPPPSAPVLGSEFQQVSLNYDMPLWLLHWWFGLVWGRRQRRTTLFSCLGLLNCIPQIYIAKKAHPSFKEPRATYINTWLCMLGRDLKLSWGWSEKTWVQVPALPWNLLGELGPAQPNTPHRLMWREKSGGESMCVP